MKLAVRPHRWNASFCTCVSVQVVVAAPLTSTVRSWMWVASCLPPSTAAPVQMPCPKMPPSVTPMMSTDAANPGVIRPFGSSSRSFQSLIVCWSRSFHSLIVWTWPKLPAEPAQQSVMMNTSVLVAAELVPESAGVLTDRPIRACTKQKHDILCTNAGQDRTRVLLRTETHGSRQLGQAETILHNKLLVAQCE